MTTEIWRWTRGLAARFGITALDQSVSSLSNFVLTIAVARIAGIEGIGTYAVAYSAWLLLADLHRSLITDPMAIQGDMRVGDASRHLRTGLASELSLGLVFAVVFCAIGFSLLVLGHWAFGIAFVGLAPWLPSLLAQDYWRWVGFMHARPATALANDGVFVVVQAISFGVLVVLGFRSPLVAIFSWGAGATAGAALGLWQFSVRPTLRGGFQRIWQRRSLSKWLVGQTGMGSISQQVTTVMMAALLGPVGLGGYRAARNLVGGPSQVLLQANGSLGLPEASRALTDRGWVGLRTVQRVVTSVGFLGVAVIAGIVLAFGRHLLVLLYGPEFGRFADIASLLAIGYLISTLGLGAELSLKATRLTNKAFHVSVVQLVIGIGATVGLIEAYGLEGAGISMIVEMAAFTVGAQYCHLRFSRSAAQKMFDASMDRTSESRRGIGSGDLANTKVASLPGRRD